MSSPKESDLIFRPARRGDLERVVQLLFDDPLGSRREVFADPLPAGYVAAFEAIEADPNNELVVVEHAGEVVGVLQLTFIPGITLQGAWRAQIEGVRVAAGLRSSGVGRRMFLWAIHRAAERDCQLLQLTSDKARPDAIRFYKSLGFVASHEGMKLSLPVTRPGEDGDPVADAASSSQ